jgi:NAD(P)-dependent dehydrogenase (short-subunit alcohol dehydrogenase family)
MSQPQSDKPLAGKVAVVTGASRGAGRGIALELGAAGATVYVTGRTRRGVDNPAYNSFRREYHLNELPGSVDDTAEQLTALGGRGIPVICDYTQEAQVQALFRRVDREAGRLDILVNNAWGGHQEPPRFNAKFWELPIANWDAMLHGGVRNHILATQYAAPLLLRQQQGLIVTVSFWADGRYMGNFFYDLAKSAMNRFAFNIAEEFRPHNITSLAVSPGWMRTEFVLAVHQATESTWQDQPDLQTTESPRYVGRAVVHLACDPNVLAKSGGIYPVGDLAAEYGFTDVDGRRVPRFRI